MPGPRSVGEGGLRVPPGACHARVPTARASLTDLCLCVLL